MAETTPTTPLDEPIVPSEARTIAHQAGKTHVPTAPETAAGQTTTPRTPWSPMMRGVQPAEVARNHVPASLRARLPGVFD